MMSENLYFIGHLAPSEKISSIEDRVYKIAEEFLRLDYQLLSASSLNFYSPENIIPLDRTIITHTMEEDKSLVFWNFPFEFKFSYSTEYRRWIVSVESDVLVGENRDLNFENGKRFISVLKIILKHLPTLYGCLLGYQGDLATDEEIFNFKVRNLYTMTYFSQLYIQKLDLIDVQAAPAEFVHFDENGILIVPKIDLINGISDAISDVADYLHLVVAE